MTSLVESKSISKASTPVYSEYHHEKIFEKLLDTLTQKIPTIKQEIYQPWQEREEDKFRKMLHKYRGAFASYGFKSISKKMEVLEYSTNPIDSEASSDQLQSIFKELEDIHATYQS